MKKVTRIAIIASFATFMFAGMNVTWGNSYSDNGGGLAVAGDFGVWFDVNDATAIGWENGMKVGLAGPAGLTFRLGYEDVTTLGVGRSWWASTGNGWATSLNTTMDFSLTSRAFVQEEADTMNCDADGVVGGGALACGNDVEGVTAIDAGDFTVGINLGFGF